LSTVPHISVCICTYRRPALLTRLLEKLSCQATDALFTFSATVVDNDSSRSAEGTVREFAAASAMATDYFVEPQQNICAARNCAIANSSGSLIVFIDDDEFPANSWLLELFKASENGGIAGVLGPVVSYFDEKPPAWVPRCGFFDRPRHPSGFRIKWEEGRTGNVLLKRALLPKDELPFNPAFHRGGDTDFFRRMIGQGQVFIWCNEAVVYEVVPPSRWTRSFMLKRALLRGAITLKDPSFGTLSVLKSVLAVAVYALALPFTLLLGQGRFMNLLVRFCDHLGKLLALFGSGLVHDPYATD
jgi:glycosyltransferase involved in cell wall biosynthesis